MKYKMIRQFSFTKEKFVVVCNSKIVATARATPSKQHKGQYNLQVLSQGNESMGKCSCIIELDQKRPHHYFIYSIDNQTESKVLFGQLSYEILAHYYSYTIIIGQRLYRVRSSDLRDRRLTIIDTITSNFNHPETLFQMIDSLSKSSEVYHVTIHDQEWSLGYLAMTILLHLHESQM